MVRGLDKFRKTFGSFTGNYVIIGGTACGIHELKNTQIPRATKDIDIILIVEALSSEFVENFWEFVKEGGYADNLIGETADKHKHQYYRFKNPANQEFPMQLELFSRNIGIIKNPVDFHLTPIHTDEDLSSLSAILLDDDYYYYTVNNSIIEDGIHIASIESLICLKCKAYLEMINGKVETDSKHIKKHRNDIFRLGAMLVPDRRYVLPDKLKEDISRFCDIVSEDLPDNNLFRSANIKGLEPTMVLEVIKNIFIGG